MAKELHITGVNKNYGSVTALVDVSLSVAAGQSLALLGPSGCGKTTLLRVIAGLTTPDSGSITVGDRQLSGGRKEVPPERRDIGMVFHDWALFPHMTVSQNVGYGISRAPNKQERVREVLEMVELGELSERRPDELSAGQAQRTAVARALAPSPEVLLFDEPFANLDAQLRGRLRRDIRELVDQLGMTTVFVTHDQAEAFLLGDQVAVLGAGAVLQVGTPREVYEQPKTPWLAEFVGKANLLPGVADQNSVSTAVGPVPLVAAATGSGEVLRRPHQLRLEAGDDFEVVNVEFQGDHSTVWCRREETVVEVATEQVVVVGERRSVVSTAESAIWYPGVR